MRPGLRCYAVEQVVVTTVAKSLTASNLTLPESGNIQCAEVWITTQGAPARISLKTGTAPTAGVGLYLPDSVVPFILKLTHAQAAAFAIISASGSSINVDVAYMTDR